MCGGEDEEQVKRLKRPEYCDHQWNKIPRKEGVKVPDEMSKIQCSKKRWMQVFSSLGTKWLEQFSQWYTCQLGCPLRIRSRPEGWLETDTEGSGMGLGNECR